MHLLKNVVKVFRLTAGADKHYPVLSFFYLILRIVQPFFLMFFIRIFVDGILQRQTPMNYLPSCAFFLGLHIISSSMRLAAENYIEFYQKAMRVELSARFCKKAAEMDYENTENAEVLGEMDRASNVLIFGENWELYLNAVHTFLISLGAFFICLSLMSKIPIYVVAGIVVISSLNILHGIYTQNKNYILYRKEQPLDRRWRYYNKLACDVEYGKALRTFGLSDYVRKRGENNRKAFFSLHRKIVRREERKSFVQNISNTAIEAGTMGVLGLMVFRNIITIGEFTIVLNAAKQLTGSMTEMFNAIISLYRSDKYITDFFLFLERPDRMRNTGGRTLEDAERKKAGRIEFRNVTFIYPGTDRTVLRNINLVIEPGEHLMLVGENGAGKTTLIKLIMRLYDVTEGEILYNGRNVKDYDYEDYLKQFSPVFQDFHLFDVSIYENLLFGERNLAGRRKEAQDLLKKAGLWEHIEKMKQKGDTVLSRRLGEEGCDLSLGQRQMLAFIRAALRNGGTVIMDEPTASLSPLAECRLYHQFQEFSSDRTAVFVSHRFSSAALCGKVCVLKNGEIEEYGTHEELMKGNGIYADMYRLQAQYYV